MIFLKLYFFTLDMQHKLSGQLNFKKCDFAKKKKKIYHSFAVSITNIKVTVMINDIANYKLRNIVKPINYFQIKTLNKHLLNFKLCISKCVHYNYVKIYFKNKKC